MQLTTVGKAIWRGARKAQELEMAGAGAPLGGKKAAEDKGQQGGLPGPGVAHHVDELPFFTSRLTL